MTISGVKIILTKFAELFKDILSFFSENISILN